MQTDSGKEAQAGVLGQASGGGAGKPGEGQRRKHSVQKKPRSEAGEQRELTELSAQVEMFHVLYNRAGTSPHVATEHLTRGYATGELNCPRYLISN